jgi:hypothetical protein
VVVVALVVVDAVAVVVELESGGNVTELVELLSPHETSANVNGMNSTQRRRNDMRIA